MESKTCTHCGIEKPMDDFPKTSTRSGVRKYHCNCCRACWLKRKSIDGKMRRDKANAPIINQARSLLKKYGPMTAKDLSRFIEGASGRTIAQTLHSDRDFVAITHRKGQSATWLFKKQPRRRNRTKKILAIAALPAPPVKKQPDQHDAWFAALQAEVAARKATQAAMRERV